MRNKSAEYQPPEGAQAGDGQEEYEALLRAQEAALGELTPRTRFTARLLCRMHGDWLGGIYEWAGQYRTVDVSKDGFTWPPAARVVQNMEAFEGGLLRRHALPTWSARLAEVHAELLLIHPFREGNGRLARWLADLMALQAGLPVPQYPFGGRGSGVERARYLKAVREGYLMRYEPLTDFFAEALARRGRGAG